MLRHFDTGGAQTGRRDVDAADQVLANLPRRNTRPGNHHWHLDAALVNKLLVPVQLVTVIAKTKNQRVVVKPVTLERGDDLPDLLVGLQQAIVVVRDLLPHERDVRIIRRHRHLGAVDHLGHAPAQFPTAELDLAKERLIFFSPLPALTGDQCCRT